jgi:hypothetical protein
MVRSSYLNSRSGEAFRGKAQVVASEQPERIPLEAKLPAVEITRHLDNWCQELPRSQVYTSAQAEVPVPAELELPIESKRRILRSLPAQRLIHRE